MFQQSGLNTSISFPQFLKVFPQFFEIQKLYFKIENYVICYFCTLESFDKQTN